jgi:hypothetical protein
MGGQRNIEGPLSPFWANELRPSEIALSLNVYVYVSMRAKNLLTELAYR